jgi:hypothetical protein
MNLTYQAKDAAEFKELCVWLKDNGFTGASNGARRVSPVVIEETGSESDTPWEDQYKALTGKRFRMDSNENVLLNKGKTREDLARARVERIMAEQGQTPTVVRTPETKEVGDVL